MEIVGYEVVEARIPESKDSGSVKNMFRGDVKTAISANPSLVIVIPLLGAVLIFVYIRNSWDIKKRWTLWCLYQSFFIIIFWNFEKSTIFDRPFQENYTYINRK